MSYRVAADVLQHLLPIDAGRSPEILCHHTLRIGEQLGAATADSSCASLSSSGNGQPSPARRARLRHPFTAAALSRRTLTDRPLAQPVGKPQPQHLAYLPHRQSLAWHSHPLLCGKGSGLSVVEDCRRHRPAMTLPDRVHDHRNRCSRSTGIGVHHRLERVFTINWNWCSRSAGTRKTVAFRGDCDHLRPSALPRRPVQTKCRAG